MFWQALKDITLSPNALMATVVIRDLISNADVSVFPHAFIQAWVGMDGNVRFDPKVGSLLGVFNAAPVVTPDDEFAGTGRGSGGEGGDGDNGGEIMQDHGVEQGVSEGRRKGQPGGNLMAWLEEYLR